MRLWLIQHLATLQTCISIDKHLRFYFDERTRTCLDFEFRGCGGNANNFAKYTECSDKCHSLPTTSASTTTSQLTTTSSSVAGEREVDCTAIPPVLTQNCSDADETILFYYHNVFTKTCEKGCAKGGENILVKHFATRYVDEPTSHIRIFCHPLQYLSLVRSYNLYIYITLFLL